MKIRIVKGGCGSLEEKKKKQQKGSKRAKKSAKRKKKKSSGKKDKCYHKVKDRYDIWPSAYASGALVKCRKVGAPNWGNKGKKNESLESLSLFMEGILNEEGLGPWFDDADGDGQEEWEQIGGEHDGKPCAKQPGQETKPKCVSPEKAATMSKEEKESAARRKRKEDPNPNRKGKARNVKTEAMDTVGPEGAMVMPNQKRQDINVTVEKLKEILTEVQDMALRLNEIQEQLKEDYRAEKITYYPGREFQRAATQLASADEYGSLASSLSRYIQNEISMPMAIKNVKDKYSPGGR